jgi:hypothetical protein
MALENIDGSAVNQVVGLKQGQVFSRAILIPLEEVDAERVRQARKDLMKYLSPVVARAKQRRNRNFQILTSVGQTREYDTVVTGVIKRAKRDE